MENVPKIYAAMYNIMNDIGVVGKDGHNKFQNYDYRGIDDAMLALRPQLIAHKVICLPTTIKRERSERAKLDKDGNEKGVTIWNDIDVEYKFIQIEDGSSVTSTLSGEGGDSSDKSINKAESSAYKNMVWNTFCVLVKDGGTDPESGKQPQAGNRTSKPATPRTPAQPPQGQNNAPSTQNKPLATDITTISTTLARLDRSCVVWLYETVGAVVDSDPAKFTNAEAMRMVELMKEHYGEHVDAQPNQQSTAQATPPDFEVICPNCGGEMWDNTSDRKEQQAEIKQNGFRLKKDGKQSTAAVPGYKCKDKTCKGTIWSSTGCDDK